MAKAVKPSPAGPPAIAAIVGEDALLASEAMAELLALMPTDVQRSDFEGDRAELAAVLDECRSLAMFGGHRLVVVREGDDFISRFREALEDYVESPSTDATLVFRVKSLPGNQRISKKIAAKGTVFQCAAPKPAEVGRWLASRAKDPHGLKLNGDAAELLADLIGPDLARLDSELAKLALQVEGRPVTMDDVAGTVAFQREQQMWTMTDQLSTGNIDQALLTWQQLVTTDNSAEFRAVTWLAIWLDKAVRAADMAATRANPMTIAKTLKIWPARNVDGLLKTVQKLGQPGLRAAVDRLVTTDRNNKSGVGDPVRNVELFLLSLA